VYGFDHRAVQVPNQQIAGYHFVFGQFGSGLFRCGKKKRVSFL
jgi:hypothetical protein